MKLPFVHSFQKVFVDIFLSINFIDSFNFDDVRVIFDDIFNE